jgi:hypothetical protein
MPNVGKMNRRQKQRPYSYYGGMSVGTFGMGVSSRRGLCKTLWACRRLKLVCSLFYKKKLIKF